MALQHAVEDQVVQRDGGLERIADHVVEVEARQALGLGEAVGMDHHQRAELLGLLPERREGRIGQFLAGHVGQDLDALELELLHAALKLLGRLVAVAHRHAAERDQPVGVLADIFGDAVVERRAWPAPRSRAARCNRAAAAPGEMSCMSTPMSSIAAKRASVWRMRVADVGCLLGHERLGLGRREMAERDGGRVEMRRRDLGRARHRDMGVHVDGEALRPRSRAPACRVCAPPSARTCSTCPPLLNVPLLITRTRRDAGADRRRRG